MEGGSGPGRASQGGWRSPGHEGAERLLAGGSSGSAGQGHRGGLGEGEEGAAVVVPAQFQGVRHLRQLLPQSRRAAPEEAGAAGSGSEGPVRSAELDHQQLQEVRDYKAHPHWIVTENICATLLVLIHLSSILSERFKM